MTRTDWRHARGLIKILTEAHQVCGKQKKTSAVCCTCNCCRKFQRSLSGWQIGSMRLKREEDWKEEECGSTPDLRPECLGWDSKIPTPVNGFLRFKMCSWMPYNCCVVCFTKVVSVASCFVTKILDNSSSRWVRVSLQRTLRLCACFGIFVIFFDFGRLRFFGHLHFRWSFCNFFRLGFRQNISQDFGLKVDGLPEPPVAEKYWSYIVFE